MNISCLVIEIINDKKPLPKAWKTEPQIIEKPANRLGMIIMYSIIALIATTIVWACFAKLDIAVDDD